MNGRDLWTGLSGAFDAIDYPIFLTAAFLLLYFLVSGTLRNRYRGRIGRLRQQDLQESVPTDSPYGDPNKTLKASALDRLEERFSLMKKSLPFVLFVIWVICLCLPYLSQVPSAYATIVAGVISLVIGFSLRPLLENLFSGVVIAFFRYIRIGDTVVIDDQYGLIEEIGVTHSVLKRWDWHRVVIPNAQLLRKEIRNLTLNDQFIWANVEFYVSPDSDISQVEAMAVDIASQVKDFSGAEPPSFWVMGMEKDAIKCWIAVWTNSPSEAWGARNEIRTRLVKALYEANIKLHSFTVASPDFGRPNVDGQRSAPL
jgi:moderate conductance mechanosensitive channel